MRNDSLEIKSRIDIVDLISAYVELKRAGNSLVGLCPFHSEKTPSFHVSPDKQSYHCFGCGKGGDIFDFIMEIEGFGFKEALVLLAERAGVKLSNTGGEKISRSKAHGVRGALEAAKFFFRSAFEEPGGQSARAYLERRNICAETAARFEIGWSPQSWDLLSKHLASAGFSEAETLDAGLAIKSERGMYDRFRGRVIYPINDDGGRVVGFGGRIIDGEGAKYVNSPEGPLFNKRRTLYLMDGAKRAARERGRIILVEGYMDAIRAHLSGFTETVASLGTSLTEEQAALIKRFTGLCYIAYDADGAGQEASIRGMYILQRHGVDVRVVTLPENLDPDDFLSGEDGAEKFESALKKALPLPLYHVYIKRHDLASPGKARIAREDILAGLASLPALDIAAYTPAISRGFGILEHELRGEIDARRKGFRRGRIENVKSANFREGNDSVPCVYINEGENTRDRRALDLECAFCSLLWRDEELRARWECGDLIPFFSDEASAGIAAALVSGDAPDELESRWRALGERICFERLARGDAVIGETGLKPEHADKIIEDIRVCAARRRLEVLKPLVIRGEAEKNEAAEYHELVKKLKGRPK
ncbi:MAG: DNA primase [Synergistaceae bacterium]|jgi:DNA primase|nr:DNA primase [Synergistaceae bacterium]